MKKIVSGLLTATMALGMLGTSVSAKTVIDDTVILKVNSPYAMTNNKVSMIDETQSQITPVIIDSRTLVPVRCIAEGFNAGVEWDQDTKTVIINKAPWTIKITVGETHYSALDISSNKKDGELDVPAMIIDGRTMVPIRAISEMLDKKVFWDDRGLIIIGDEDISSKIKEDEIVKILDSLNQGNVGKSIDLPSVDDTKDDTAKDNSDKDDSANNNTQTTAVAPDLSKMKVVEEYGFEEEPYGLVANLKMYTRDFVTDEKAHTGNFSLHMNKDKLLLSKEFDEARNSVLTLWIYDSGKTEPRDGILFCVDDGDSTNCRALGLGTNEGKDCYVIRCGKDTRSTNIKRSEGWHQFMFDYTSGEGVNFFIDGKFAGSEAGVTDFNRIEITDPWEDESISNLYVDDIQIWE